MSRARRLTGWLRRQNRKVNAPRSEQEAGYPLRRRFRRLSLERLEERLAPTVTSMVDPLGKLAITVTPGGDGVEDVAITTSLGNVQINSADPVSGTAASSSIRAISVMGDANANNFDFSHVNTTDFTRLVSTVVVGGGGGDTITVTGHATPMTVVKFSDGSAMLTDGSFIIRAVGIPNFAGAQATITEQGMPNWLSEGPSTITDAHLAQNPPQDDVEIGAVNQVAAHPFDPNVLFAATVSGGVWRNNDRTVFFAINSSTLDATAQAILTDYANFLNANPSRVVQVNGYTDSTGTVSGNQTLSVARANAVATFLEGLGVPAAQLNVQGKGQNNPIAPNDPTTGNALNRRVEIIANHWTPLTDAFPSLAIGSISLSPLDSSGSPVTATTPLNQLVLYAGTGDFSSGPRGGSAVGLLKSTDGGNTWSLLATSDLGRLRITSVVATGLTSAGKEIVLVSALSSAKDAKTGGIFRSTDGGASFTRLVAGNGFDLAADPGDSQRYYAAVGTFAAGTATIAGGAVTGVTITNPGAGFTAAPTVVFAGGGGTGATGTATIAGGVVTGVTITNPGSGYTSAPTVIFTGGGQGIFISDGSSGGTWTATATQPGNALADGTNADRIVLAVQANTNSTSNAVFAALVRGGIVRGVTITSRGSGYTSAPTVTFTGGGGTGAAGTATIAGGVVTGVTMTDRGKGYTSAPTVTFSGGGGTGATGTAGISGRTVVGLFQSTDQGGTWTEPFGPAPDLGSQADLQVSLQPSADGTKVFIGGAPTSLFLGNSSSFSSIVQAGANNTAPHADSRSLVFDAAGRLVETDDGGIYRLTIPFDNDPVAKRTWSSANADLVDTETLSLAYDPLNNAFFSGNQDNGSTVQSRQTTDPVDSNGDGLPDDFATRSQWTEVLGGDGQGQIAVQTDATHVLRFSLSNNFGLMQADLFDNNGNDLTPHHDVGLRSAAGNSGLDAPDRALIASQAFVLIPYVVNAVDSTRMLIGFFSLYESSDRLETLKPSIFTSPVNVDPNNLRASLLDGNFYTALAYGGMKNGVPQPDVIYAARGSKLFVRLPGAAANGFTALPSPSSARIVSIVMDPDNWETVYVADGSHIFKSTDHGQHWDPDVSAKLNPPGGGIRTLSIVSQGAVGTATVAGGAVTGVTVTNPGRGYTSAPTVTFLGGGGTGAAGTAIITGGVVTSVTITNPGSGYTSTPTVIFSGADKVLLAGTTAGAYRAINPAANVSWVQLGQGLPNAVVGSLGFTSRPGQPDVLYAGTQGRGAWAVYGDVASQLDTPSTLEIDGTSANDTFKIKREAGNPLLLDIFINSTSPLLTLPLNTIQSLIVKTGGGNDTLILDSSNGPLSFGGSGATVTAAIASGGVTGVTVSNGGGGYSSVPAVIFSGGGGSGAAGIATIAGGVVTGVTITNPGSGYTSAPTVTFASGISFDGDMGSTLELDGGMMSTDLTSTSTATTTTRVITLQGDTRQESVTTGKNAAFTNTVTPPTTATKDGAGLQDFFNWINRLANLPTSGGTTQPQLAVLDTSLFDAIMGVSRDTPVAEADSASEATPTDDTSIPGWLRLLESGTGAFDISTIGSSITTFAQLQSALQGLGATVTGTDLSNVSFQLTKTLDGQAALDTSFSPGVGQVTLNGTFDIQAQVTLNLAFGVDGSGFFIDTSNSSLAINHIALNGEGHAAGRFGFLDVGADVNQLMIDPSVGLNVTFSGGPLRISDLTGDLGTHATVTATGNTNHDIALQLNVTASAIIPGVDSFNLGTAQLTISWANVNDPTNASIAANAGFANDVLDFLKVDVQKVRDEIAKLTDLSAALHVNIPFVSNALADVLNLVNFIDSKIISPLTLSDGTTVNFPSAQALATRLIQSLGIDPAALGLSFDATKEVLTYHLHVIPSVTSQVKLGNGVNLAQGLADLNFSTTASASASLTLDATMGIDIKAIVSGESPDKWFFIKDASAGGTLDLTANNVNASARFGFLSISVFQGLITAHANATITLKDPGTDNDGRIDMGELIDGLTHLSDLVSANITGNANMSLPIKAPFLGITSNTPTADNTLVVTLPDFTDFKTATVTIPAAIQNVGNFAHIDAASFVSLMGQVTGALDQFRRSGTFANFKVPLLGPALDKVLALNEAFRNALLIDEGPDGTIDGSDQLDTVINNALKAAGLDSQLHAEISGGKIRLLANDFSGTSFTLTALGGNALGFDTTQTSMNLTVNGPQAITATSAAPSNGQIASDTTFTITFAGGGVTNVVISNGGSAYTSAPTVSFSGGGGTGAAATAIITNGSVTGVTITNPGSGYTSAPDVTFTGGGGSGAVATANAVTVHASDTSSDTGLGNDHWKLVDANNAATFSTVDEMAIRIAQILNFPVPLQYNPSDQTLTFTLNLTPTFGQIDLPLNFNLNLSPLLQLTSNSSLRLMADGSLHLTVGVYLGNAPSSSQLDPTKPLSAINGGVPINTAKVITGTMDVRTVYGRLSADASFTLSVNGGNAQTVTITKSSTANNASAADLATEITTALGAAGISNVTATAIGNRILLVGGTGVTSMHLSASSGNTAVTEIGFAVAQDAALEIIAPQDAPAGGQLTADASFQITINGGAATTVTVTQASTSSNSSVSGLVSSINAALQTAGLNTQLQAVAIGNRIALMAVPNASVTSVHLSANSGDPAVTQIGLGTSQDAVPQAVAGNDLPTLWGRLSADATFNLSLDTVNGGSPVAVTVTQASTANNRFTFDIVNEVQAAINATALNGKVTVGFANNRLTLTAAGATNFSLTAAGTATTELGLGATNTGNDFAFYITTRDGNKYGISLDGLSTLSDLFNAISTQTSGKVTAALNDRMTGINLTDSSTGGAMFAVTAANNSNAAATLGILAQDTQDNGAHEPDGVIEGADIAGLKPGDRFFLQDVGASVGLHLTSPTGLALAAHLGFLNIGLSGTANVTATLGLNLKDPGTDGDNRISLTELFNSLSDITTLLNAPSLTGGGDISLTANVSPALPGLTVSTDPIVLHINSWGDPFAGTPPDVSLTVPPDLVAFNKPDFTFQNVLDGLKALTSFLGQFSSFGFLKQPLPLVHVSIDDLVNLADKFATALDQAAANPAGTVQELQDKLKEAFGIPKASNALTLALFTDTNVNPSQDFLRVTIDLNKAFSKSLSVNMDLSSGLSLGGSAGLAASGNLDAKLDFGIDLHNPTNIAIFDQTGLSANLTGTASALNFKAAIGPAGIFVENGNATITVGASGGINSNVFTNHHVALTDLLANLTSDLFITPTGSVHASLPVFFPTETRHAGDITLDWNDITITDSSDPNGPHLVVPNNLLTIDPSQFSFLDELGLGVDGIDLFLGGLQDLLDGSLGGVKLPLVGDKLNGVAQVIGDFRTKFVEPFRKAIADLQNPADAFAQGGTDPVSKILYPLLGPAGANLLEDSNNDGSVGPDDITFTDNLNQQGVALQDLFVHWHFKLGGTLVSANPGIGFDVGIPGLGLSTQGNLSIQLGWSLQFGFGLDFQHGFSIDVGPNSGLRLDLDVSVPGGGITGTLGFLQLSATDHAADPTHLGATFAIGIFDGSDPNKTQLPFTDLGNITITPFIGAEAVVDLDTRLSLSSTLIPNAATNFPSVVAEFLLDWTLGDRAGYRQTGDLTKLVPLSALNGDFLSDGLQFVGFKNVGLDLGTYFSNFIEPIAKKIQEYTAPMKPFLDFITAPIPVISQLAGPTSLLDIAAKSGLVNAGLVQGIELVDKIVDIANQLGNFNGSNAILYFGTKNFALYDSGSGGNDIFNPGTLLNLSNPGAALNAVLSGQFTLPASWGDLGMALSDALNTVAPVLKDAINSMDQAAGGAPGTSFSLPILKDPSQIFGMLMGKHAVLLDLNLAPFDLKASFSAFFSIFGPLGVSINADFAMHMHFDFGYDTLGVEEFAKGGFKNPLLLFDGFFINDLDQKGQPEQQLVFDAGLWAAAELNLGIARAGVGGGLFAHIQFHLHDVDGDNRVRIGELVTEIVNEAKYGSPVLAPLAIFDISGNLKARLFAFLKIDLFLFHLDKFFDITPPLTLLDFQSNFVRIPTLATDLGDGVLQLNVGPNAAQRVEGNLNDDSGVEVHVKQGSDANHVLIWAPGLGVSEGMAQEYAFSSPPSGKRPMIIAKGGKGNDIIDCSGVTADVNYDLEDPAGNNLIKAGSGHGQATIVGGSGDDTLWGGNGDDIIIGGPGQNEIHGVGGKDIILGNGTLKDIDLQNGKVYSPIRAGDVGNTIYGGSGHDIIIGGGGSNIIYGETGGHTIIGNGGKVAFDPMTRNVFTVSLDANGLPQINWVGGVVNVTLTDKGIGGHVTIYGGSGDNLIYGGPGTAEIHGGAGHNIIYTGPGNDLVYGGNAGDAIYGGPGQNTIHGGTGADLIHTGNGKDYVDEAGGNNWIYGGAGDDTLIGGLGDDHIFGGTGNNLIYGGGGNNYLQAGSGGMNKVYGYSPSDNTLTGNDTLVGGSGDDFLDGGNGADTYLIFAHGGDVDRQTYVYDSGTDAATDTLIITAPVGNDSILFRAMADYYYHRYYPTQAKVSAALATVFNDPTINDPLGFGASAIALSTNLTTLSTLAPPSGKLTSNVNFSISDGTYTGVGILHASNTSAFSSLSQLVTALQGAVNAALATLHAAGSSSTTTITVGQSGGHITFTASASDLSIQANHDLAALKNAVISTYTFNQMFDVPDGMLDALTTQYGLTPNDVNQLQNAVTGKYIPNALAYLYSLAKTPFTIDPLGFGLSPLPLSTNATVLSKQAPSNGQLTQDVSFTVSDGTHKGVGVLPASVTSGFSSLSQLVTALQGAVNDALAKLHTAGSSSTVTITVGQTGGAISFTASGTGLSLTQDQKLAQIEQAITNAYFPASVPVGMFAALAAADITSFSSIEAAIASAYTPLATDTGFVALLNNGGKHLERFNYRNITSLVLNTVKGDNHIVLDDVIGATTINLGQGNSRVQVGQVFNSQRVGDFNALITGILPIDAFGTLPITRGWLSNGISQPTTINGGPGNDQFTVFHNIAVLTLNGGSGDDLFTIRSFALLGSIDSTRARTDIKGGSGNDTILYVSNAPVNVNGGTGFNTLRVIGTEFADDYVVTDHGIFGAGLNITYVNIQKIIVDGAEGNDRFFVLSTSIDTVTELDGDLGSNTFFVGGDPQGGAPIPVVSNDLRGFSGVIQHSVTSNDPTYNGIVVDGISANVVDNNEANIIVTETDGISRVTKGATSGGQHWAYDTYTLRLSRAPAAGQEAIINVVPSVLGPADLARGAATLQFLLHDPNDPQKFLDASNDANWVLGANYPALHFAASGNNAWNIPQTIKFRAPPDFAENGTHYIYINNTAQHSTDPDYANAKVRSVKVQINDDNKAGVLITPAGLGLTVLEGGFTDSFNVQLTRVPTANVMVTLSLANNYLNLTSADPRFNAATKTITFTSADYNIPVAITVSANADGVTEGFHTDFISYTVTSADVDTDVSVSSYLVNGDFGMGDNFNNPLPIPPDKPTSYLYLRHAPDLSQPVTILYNSGSGDVTLTPVNPSDQSQLSDDQVHYSISGNLVDFYKDGSPVAISGSVHASYSYVKAGYNNMLVKDSVVDIYDADTSMVIVTQKTGSTNVIEGDPTSSDTYIVQLSRAPSADVTINVASMKTRTTIASTGQANFDYHVYVNGALTSTLTFTSANWNVPQTVTVTAVTDNYVDGDDTKVFLPGLQTTHKIRGPLILNGAGGSGSLSLPAPLMLPGEQNIRPSDGQVVGFTAGSGPGAIETMTVNKADLVNKLPAFAGSNPPINTIFDLVGKTIELTQGPGTGIVLDPTDPFDLFNRFWLINVVTDLGNGLVQLTLQNPTRVDPSQTNVIAPTSATKYAVTSLSVNFFDDPRKDINYLMVFNNDSVAAENGALTSSTGNVLSFASVNGTDQMTVNTADLQAIQSLNNNLSLLVGHTLNISVGPGLGRVWTIAGITDGTSRGTKVLTLTEVSGSGTPTNRSEFRVAGIGNTRGRITGFGMGPNIVVGNTIQSGGITYSNMEVVRMDAGNGNNNILVDYTTNSADGTVQRTAPFYTLTMLNTGNGNNHITMNLKDGEDGAFALNMGSGNDYADGSQSTLGLVIFGGLGNNTIKGGTGNDIIFGSQGRVDYLNGNGFVVTRLGFSEKLDPINPNPTSATAMTLTDTATTFYQGHAFATEFGGFVGLSVQAISPAGTVQYRTIVANTPDTVTIDRPWDTIPDSTWTYRVSTLPENQTDGTFRGPRLITSVFNDLGGNNTIYEAGGNNTIIASAGNDTVYGGTGNDVIIGNDAVLNYTPISGNDGPTRLVDITPGTVAGNNSLIGGIGNDVIIGGLGNDYIRGSIGNDILIGDNAYIHYNANQIVDHIESINRDQGGNNTIYGGRGDNIIIGGPRDDSIDGGAGKDLIFANNALLDRSATLGDYRNPRFRVLSGTQIYSTDPATAGQALIDPTQTFVDPRGPAWWADFQITLLDHDTSTPTTRYGNNYIAGGPGDKEIFGGLGNDTIQGHGSIDLKPMLYFYGADQQITINRLLTLADIQYNASDPVDVARATQIIAQINSGRVGAWRFVPTASFASEIRSANNLPATWGTNLSAMVTGYLFLRPSFENFDHFDANGNPVSAPGNDGSSYIEGGGGNDVIFGDGGQNDIIGGNSDLFSLTTRNQRPSGSNLIFGGAGTDIARNDLGDTSPQGHARDSDMIISNNGDIFRLVGVTVNGQAMLAPAVGPGSVGGVNTFNGFLSFNYDNYTDGLPLAQQLKIIPRAAKLLDYTPGGPAFNPTAAAQDIGGSTEIHGENGDNFIFGEKGNNLIYGGGQDDQIVGGYGTNWISGGAGNATIIATDGRIFASRNGLAEPLNGVTAIPANQLNLVISAPGKAQQATINVAGQLKTTVDLEPFSQDTTWNGTGPEWQGGFTAPHQSDDIVFGGIGNDTIHGGYGDDAISGGEALPLSYVQTYDAGGNLTGVAESDYYQPYNPGNVLRFNPIDPSGTHPPRQVGRTGQFALYDEFDPRRKILLNSDGTANKTGTGLPWFLDLNANDGPLDPRYPASANIHTDGNDNIFGDLGNNWIVGGTGQNDLFGGFGNDLLDARSSQDINGGLNNQPDSAVSNTNRAFGGAGKDVLIADNAADRLIDWVGNFNTYIVSFSQWGMPTVSRTVQPGLPQFLYALSKSDGADQTLATDFGTDPTRNGEPAGELGLVLQHDAAWHSQTGAPSDQPPGNVSGSKRTVIKAATFNGGKAPSMFVDSGTWTPSANYYQGVAAAGGDAVSLFDFDIWLPSYYELLSTFKLTNGGTQQNAFLIFDYQNSTNFKYAGLDASQQLLRIGQRTAAGWIDGATLSYKVNLNTNYSPKLTVNGTVATLTVGSASLSYTFSGLMNTGLLGLGVNSAVATFTWEQVQELPRVFTYQVTPTISSTGLSGFTVQSGQWSVNLGSYYLTPPTGGAALSTRPLNVAPSSYVEFKATVNASTNGMWAGLAFAYTSLNDFLFAAIVPGSNQVILGHRNPAGWFVDAVATRTITAGTNYTLLIALDNSPAGGANPTVTVVLNGQSAVNFSYNFQMVAGPTQGNLQLGLLAQSGSASFSNLSIRGNDPAYSGGGTPQLAAALPGPVATAPLRPDQLQSIIAAAIRYWAASSGFGQSVAALADVPFAILDLPGLMLGQTIAGTIVISPTAAGYGWFIDLTPYDSAEFSPAGGGTLLATVSSPANGHMDLLTVVMHELGHLLGREDLMNTGQTQDLMNAVLTPGTRRLPSPAATLVATGSSGRILPSHGAAPTNLNPAPDTRQVPALVAPVADFNAVTRLVMAQGSNPFRIEPSFADGFVAEEKTGRSPQYHTPGYGIEPPVWRLGQLSEDLLTQLAALRSAAVNRGRSEDTTFPNWEAMWSPVDEALVTALASGLRG